MGRKTEEPEQQENADRGLEVIEGELGTASKIRHVRSEGRWGVADEKIYDDGQERCCVEGFIQRWYAIEVCGDLD